MSKKRHSLEAHVEGERVDGELHQAHKASKKPKRRDDGTESFTAFKEATGGARDGSDGNASSSSSSGDENLGEAAGDELTSSSEDSGDFLEVRSHRPDAADGGDEDLGPAPHGQSLLSAKVSSLKDTENGGNEGADRGRAANDSDEAASEDEETEEITTPRRRSIPDGEAYDDSSQSSSSSGDGESDEEEEEMDDGEQRPDKSTAFGRAFRKIMKKKLPSTSLTEAMGPILSSHKQLVTKKLEEASEGRKVRSESKKAKQALREKGHTVPSTFPASKDKELLKLATRGVVKLFNAVSKAQSVQEVAVSKAAEAKEVEKRSKSTFLAMLQSGNGAVSQSLNTQRQPSDSSKEGAANGQPGWSALQDTFMLGKSRLKDWDKREEDAADESEGAVSSGDDSDGSD